MFCAASTAREPKGIAFYIKLGIICLIAAAAAIYNLSLKAELHTDEYVAYVIANHTGEPASMFSPDTLTLYEDPAEPYLRDMTVAAGEGFRFSQVCANDATDTNPPLHYILLHAISSFFPGQFSYWFGGAINILFIALSAFMLCRLALLLGCSDTAALLSALLLALLPAVLEIAQFIRMYTMCMFFCIWLACGQVKCVRSERFTWRTASGLALPTVCGALTHYYFLLFAGFGGLCAGAYLIFSRRFKHAVFYVASFAAAALLTLAVFPQMIGQMFGGWLTGASVDNLAETSDMLSRLKAYYFVINTRIFGGYLPIFALTCVLSIFLLAFSKKSERVSIKGIWSEFRPWALCVVFPCLLYFFLVAKISFFTNTRYMCLIYPFIILAAVEGASRLLYAGIGGSRASVGILCAVCVIALVGSMRLSPAYSREYSGADASRINAMSDYGSLNALCVFDAPWSAETTYNLNKSMNGLVFATQGELEGVPKALGACPDGFVAEIRSTFDSRDILTKLLSLYPELNAAELIANDYFYDIYLIR